MTLMRQPFALLTTMIALFLCAPGSSNAQDGDNNAENKASQKNVAGSKPDNPKKQPRAERPVAAKPVKTDLASDGKGSDDDKANLSEVLEIHGVACERCNDDTCNGCKMAPLPEGLESNPHGDSGHGAQCGCTHCKMRDNKMHHKKGAHHMQHVRKAVVRVVNARGRGTGFLYGSRRHVITAFSVVESGRKTYVVDHNGAEIGARIVGTDRGAGLALLELDAELSGAQPLEVAHGKSGHMGPAMVVGNHFGAGQRWGVDLNKLTNGVVQPAMVSNKDGDALLLGNTFPDTFAGAPVVAPSGHVVGVLRWAKKKRHSSIATSAHRLQGFYKAHSDRNVDEYNGRIRLRLGGGLLAFAGNESTFGAGLQLSTSVDLYDMFGVTLRAAYALGTQDLADDDITTSILSRNYGRWILDAVAYYRFLLPSFGGKTIPVSIGAGGAYVADSGDERVLDGGTFVTNEFDYDRGMLEADLQVGWLRGSFFIRPDETEDWFFTLSASMQY